MCHYSSQLQPSSLHSSPAHSIPIQDSPPDPSPLHSTPRHPSSLHSPHPTLLYITSPHSSSLHSSSLHVHPTTSHPIPPNPTLLRLLYFTQRYCWFSNDVTKNQTTKLLIPLTFYFHGPTVDLKTNIHTNCCCEWVLGSVVDYA